MLRKRRCGLGRLFKPIETFGEHGFVCFEGIVDRHVQYVVDFAQIELSVGRSGSFLIFLQGHVVVLDGFGEISAFVLAGAASVGGVDVVGVDLENGGEVFDALVDLAEFLERAAADIVSAGVHGVEFHECVAVEDAVFVVALFEQGGGADEEGLLVGGVFLEFLGADSDQIVDVEGLSVDVWWSEEKLSFLEEYTVDVFLVKEVSLETLEGLGLSVTFFLHF